MKQYLWRAIPVVMLVILAALFWRGLSLDPQKLPSTQLGHRLPEFRLPVLTGPKQIFTSESLRGEISILNVWASWCEACIEEQAFLLQLSKSGMPVFGLNYKDDRNNALQWLQEWGNPYRAIGEDSKGNAAIDLGVYVTPETFLIDKQGVIRFRHVGILSKDVWQRDFAPRIKELQERS
ncbi:DsbE family thiol:disulfide interchange protein [Legionella dresdenensis]|uniref:DsbE family thiol:disulfide interchange protein n=1 Tax=Legionella dresdenensis TaxID=450200 RepID=A0ABV8CBQ3_9GAMM